MLEPVGIPFGLDSIQDSLSRMIMSAHILHILIVTEFHEKNLDYMNMEWPAYSPDVNPIEQAWHMLGRAV